MEIRVLFFGMLKDFVRVESEVLVLPENATVENVVQHYKPIPQINRLFPSIAISVNQEYAVVTTKLKHGDEVALLPPVSGGSSGESAQRSMIVRQEIDTQYHVESVKDPSDGAVVVFEGVVRDNTRGRRTLYLDYESYESMAAKQMESLCAQALAEFAIRDVRIVHRVGRIKIGETSVLIAVASAHRAAAFDACRWLIDTLKRTVPIWKREFFEDGAAWADGEPFPGEMAAWKAPIR